jgi:hypothetical protein
VGAPTPACCDIGVARKSIHFNQNVSDSEKTRDWETSVKNDRISASSMKFTFLLLKGYPTLGPFLAMLRERYPDLSVEPGGSCRMNHDSPRGNLLPIPPFRDPL